MDHEETRCRLVVDERSATSSLPPHRRRSSLATRSRYVVFQTRNERQVLCAAEDTGLTGAIIGGGPVVGAAGPAMRRWARRGCCYPSTPDQRWVTLRSTPSAPSHFWPIVLFSPETGGVAFFPPRAYFLTRVYLGMKIYLAKILYKNCIFWLKFSITSLEKTTIVFFWKFCLFRCVSCYN